MRSPSVDELTFSTRPEGPPKGKQANWGPTKPGRKFFLLFRFCRPEPAARLRKTVSMRGRPAYQAFTTRVSQSGSVSRSSAMLPRNA